MEDRRRFLKTAAIAGGAAWVAPSIASFDVAAALGSGCPLPTDDGVTGIYEILAVPPASVVYGALVSTTRVRVFCEVERYVLEADLPVDDLVGVGGSGDFYPGGLVPVDDPTRVIPTGTRICSYLVHMNICTDNTCTAISLAPGPLTFSTTILGVIWSGNGANSSPNFPATGNLFASDPGAGILPANSVTYPADTTNLPETLRGSGELPIDGANWTDSVFMATAIATNTKSDQIRIITAAA